MKAAWAGDSRHVGRNSDVYSDLERCVDFLKMKGKSFEEVGAVVLGASSGALCRWLTVDSSYFRSKPFLGILCVNGIGSLILGTLVGYQSIRAPKPHLSLL
jgi:hypothetical protein